MPNRSKLKCLLHVFRPFVTTFRTRPPWILVRPPSLCGTSINIRDAIRVFINARIYRKHFMVRSWIRNPKRCFSTFPYSFFFLFFYFVVFLCSRSERYVPLILSDPCLPRVGSFFSHFFQCLSWFINRVPLLNCIGM